MKRLSTQILLLSISIISIMRGYGMQDAQAATVADNYLPTTTLDTIVITGSRDIMRPRQSAEDIYNKNESSTYKDKEDIERYMGESPADIFEGMTGVQSGDARNSGAIDPNVRGIQGQGRVPVTIDGTEQAITVYRGYSGANNRNYI